MSEYQVIARKWRPQSFRDVVGQQHVVRTLKNAISQNRTAHAYLFVGPRGVGKTTLARIFAKAMNCANPQNGEPCCQCDSCLAIAQDRSLDVLEVDAASRNSTNDMRELSEDVLTRPVGGKYKIYIIDEVHMLSKAAWNVLLKTVEEPPSHVKFIFATTEVHQVLPTIISRCQRFDLLPIPTKLIAERLRLVADTEKVQIRQDAIDAIARAAEGGMRDAQSLLDQMIAFFSQAGEEITGEQVLSLFGLTDRNDLDILLGALISNKPQDAVLTVGRLSKRGKNLETLYDDLLEALRITQLCAILPNPAELLDEGEETINHYRGIALQTTPAVLQTLLEHLAPVGRVLHDALNKQVYLETILLKAMREAHAVSLEDVLARLNQLRTAGELKFLEQVPPVTAPAAVIPQPVAAVQETEEKKKAETSLSPAPVEPVQEPETVSMQESAAELAAAPVQKTVIEPVAETVAETVIEPIAETVTAPVAAPVQETVIEPVAETVAETVTAPVAAPVQETIIEPVAEPVAETVTAPVAAPVQETIIEPAAEQSAVSQEMDDNDEPEIEAETVVTKSAPELEIGPQDSKASVAPAGNHLRESVINKDSSALRSVLNDPVVKNVVDLFSGPVIDIHR